MRTDAAVTMRIAIAIFACCIVASTAGAQAAPAVELQLDAAIAKEVKKYFSAYGNRWAISLDPDGARIASLSGRPDKQPFPTKNYRPLLERLAPLAGRPLPTLSPVPLMRSVGDSVQLEFPQTYGDKRVENASVTVTINPWGTYDILLSHVPAVAPGPKRRDAMSAAAAAEEILQKEMPEGAGVKVLGSVPEEPTLLAHDGRIFRVYRVTVQADLRTESGEALLAVREYAIDASTTSNEAAQAVVRVLRLDHRYKDGTGRVFDPNPINKLNRCQLLPRDVPVDAYTDNVPLRDLRDAEDQTFALCGRLVEIIDKDHPHILPPRVHETADAPDFSYRRGCPDFAAVMAYFHIDRMQRYVDELGFPELVRSLQADVVAGEVQDAIEARYIDYPIGNGYLRFARKGLIYVAEDADVIAHEYGHALLARNTDGRFNISRYEEPTSQAGLISEGFADYWALSSSFDATTASGHDLDCWAEWAHGGGCARKYTTKPSVSQLLLEAGDHENGTVWSGTLFHLFQAVGNHRVIADYLILKGHLSRAGTGRAPRMQEIAEGIVMADERFGDEHKQALCDVFERHLGKRPKCCSQPCTGTVPLSYSFK